MNFIDKEQTSHHYTPAIFFSKSMRILPQHYPQVWDRVSHHNFSTLLVEHEAPSMTHKISQLFTINKADAITILVAPSNNIMTSKRRQGCAGCAGCASSQHW